VSTAPSAQPTTIAGNGGLIAAPKSRRMMAVEMVAVGGGESGSGGRRVPAGCSDGLMAAARLRLPVGAGGVS
jgi:hypothetical protein